MKFSRQDYWSGLLFPSPGNLPDPGIEPGSPELQADALQSEPLGKPIAQLAKHLPARTSIPGLGRSPGEGEKLLTPVFWPGELPGL